MEMEIEIDRVQDIDIGGEGGYTLIFILYPGHW